eukprot:NODE_96_length_20709_cov_1.429161.p12 type:complete len:203 gc:universal NODE_96_length_20709_cov_1.429161:19911-19303(-)
MLLCFCILFATAIPSSYYDGVSYKSIYQGLVEHLSGVKTVGMTVYNRMKSTIQQLPARKIAIATGLSVVGSSVIFAGRDYIHDKSIHIYSIQCEDRVKKGSECKLKIYVNGIDSFWGLKRLTIYLQGDGKSQLLVKKALKLYIKHAKHSEQYPYIGFGEVVVPFTMPNVRKGEYKIQAIIHWLPSEYLFRSEDISSTFLIGK